MKKKEQNFVSTEYIYFFINFPFYFLDAFERCFLKNMNQFKIVDQF